MNSNSNNMSNTGAPYGCPGGAGLRPTSSTNDNNPQQQQLSTSPRPEQYQQQQQFSYFSTPPKETDVQNLLKQLDEIKYYQASSSPLPSVIGSQKQKDFIDKMHRILPQFLNIFGTTTNTNYHHQHNQNHSSYSSRSHLPLTSTSSSRNYCGSASSLDRDIDTHSLASLDSSLSLAAKTPTSPCPPRDPPLERYPIIQSFAYTTARLFVAEVRQRASNKKAEDASLAILEYLNPEIKKLLTSTSNKNDDIIKQQQPTTSSSNQQDDCKQITNQPSIQPSYINSDEISHGWNLLLTLQTLSVSTQANSIIIQSLCDASLPSTLMKCLYLFFDLEPVTKLKSKQTSGDLDKDIDNDATANATTSALDIDNHNIIMSPLISVFTQILVHLCNSRAAIDELIKKDDLRLLFCLASTQCEKHNQPWRLVAFETLSSISKTMRDNFGYLKNNNCILNYVENLHKLSTMATISLMELVDMTICLSEFVYHLETNNRNQIRCLSSIIEQMVSGRFIDFIEELLTKLDDLIELTKCVGDNNNCDNSNQQSATGQQQQQQQQQNSIEECRRLARRLIKILPLIAKINIHPEAMSPLLTLKPCATTRYDMFENFRMPKPSALHCILNLEALRLLKTIWSRCRDIYLIESILDATITLFHHDKYNYFIFEDQQLLVYYLTSDNFSSFPVRIKQKLFKFIEFITIETNYIPCLELGTLGSLMKQDDCNNTNLILIMKTLIACLRINSKFSDIFREIGILEIVIDIFLNAMRKQKLYLNQLHHNQLVSAASTSAAPTSAGNAKQTQQTNPLQQSIIGNQNNQIKLLPINDDDQYNIEVLYLSLEVSYCLLSGPNNDNCRQFNESGAARQVFSCLAKPHQFYPLLHQHSSSSDESASDMSLCQSPTPAYMAAMVNNNRSETPPLSSSTTATTTNTTTTTMRSINQPITAAAPASQQFMQHSKPSVKQIQKVSFNIIRQLILSSAGDEHLANLLGLLARSMEDLRNSCQAEYEASRQALCASFEENGFFKLETNQTSVLVNHRTRQDLTTMISHEINLKICILKSLMIVLKESHRCRMLFRKTGGFLCVVAALEAIRKCLPLPPASASQSSTSSSSGFAKTNDGQSLGNDNDNDNDNDRSSSSKQEEADEIVLILRNLNSRRIWRFIKSCLMTIVIAMRFEPANVRSFTDDALTKFTEAIRMLGCFRFECKQLGPVIIDNEDTMTMTTINSGLQAKITNNNDRQQHQQKDGDNNESETTTTSNSASSRLHGHEPETSGTNPAAAMSRYKSIFIAAPTRDYSTIPNDNIKPDLACCQLIRFLYDMSLDMGDGTADLERELEHQMQSSSMSLLIMNNQRNSQASSMQHSIHSHAPQVKQETKSISFDRANSMLNTSSVGMAPGIKESDMFKRRSQLNAAPKRPPSLDLNTSRFSKPANLTFPNLIMAILDLLPSCPNKELMLFTSMVIKSLFKHERNRQLLCEYGLISKLLDKNLQLALVDRQHFLHDIFEFLFEKLSKELITTKELSCFLRIGQPMLCSNLDEIDISDELSNVAGKSSSSSIKQQLSNVVGALSNDKVNEVGLNDENESNYLSATSTPDANLSRTGNQINNKPNTRDGDPCGVEQPDVAQQTTDRQNREKISRDKIDSLVAMMNHSVHHTSVTSAASHQTNTGRSSLQTITTATIQHYHRDMSQPPFVEFDMSLEGLSLIFMPSIAPINVKLLPPHSSSFLNSTLDVHTNEKNGLLGGVGVQERQFPPTNGLTFSSWICINTFPSRSSDPNHNLRLLTIYRGSASTGKEYSCLRAEISALDRALIVSTQETLLFEPAESSLHHHRSSRAGCADPTGSANSNSTTQSVQPESNFRIWTPELLLENRWHHLAITIQRPSTSQSSSSSTKLPPPNVVVYVDGVAAHTDRLSYISPLVGPPYTGAMLGNQMNSSSGPSAAAFVNAFIGSLPQFRSQPQVRWKQGPLHLIEEPLSSSFIAVIYALGPRFIGNFQSSIKLNELARARLLQLAQSDLKFFKQLNETSSHSRPLKHHHHQSLHNSSSSGGGRAPTQVRSSGSSDRSGGHHLSRVGSAGAHHASSGGLSGSSATNSSSSSNNNSQNNTNQYSLPEERLLISIHASATSSMTLARMRKIYTRFDCRQISRVLGLSLHENSTPILLLHNTCLHLTGPSRGVGAVTIGYNLVRFFVPNPVHQIITTLGGCHILLAFIAQAETIESFELSMMALISALRQNSILQAQMDSINGYQILEMFFWKKRHLLNENILMLIFALITETTKTRHFDHEPKTLIIQQVGAVRDLICECFDLWTQTNHIDTVLEFIYELINSTNHATNTTGANSLSSSSSSIVSATQSSSTSVRLSGQAQLGSLMSSARSKNLKCLRDLDLLPAILRLLPHFNSTINNNVEDNNNRPISTSPVQQQQEMVNERLISADGGRPNDADASGTSSTPGHLVNGKAIYLIRQIVFELLNRTPRQSDLLYFGQFLASLLPLDMHNERPAHIINLRNILLKSLLQMMTKNKQPEVNRAMQEELVRILGFDWFMLFFTGKQLHPETITIGFLNFVVVLSNDDLYENFKSKTAVNFKGGWLKEPYFGSIDGKFNIQLLGMNVGFFFGTGTKRKSIRQSIIEAPNLFLLTSCLRDLTNQPNIYLMLLMLIMNKLNEIDPITLDTIGTFDKLSFDSLCDCLVGETHHQRRQTLAGIHLKRHELIICLIYMIRETMSDPSNITNQVNQANEDNNTPTHIIKFLMYLYNNNQDFQFYSRRSEELMQALCECFMVSNESTNNDDNSDNDWTKRALKASEPRNIVRMKTQHPAFKELLEISRLIMLDSMVEVSRWQQQVQNQSNTSGNNNPAVSNELEPLHAVETMTSQLDKCPEARDELIDMLMTQILLMIDSTARNNSSQTLGSSDMMVQFQMLLVNSILVAQFATDRIWNQRLYQDDLGNCTRMIEHQLCLTEQVFKFNELLPAQKNPSHHAFIMQRTLNRTILSALSPSRPLNRGSDKMLQLELLKRIYNNRNIIIFNHMQNEHSAEFFVCLTYCLMAIMDANSISPQHQANQSQSASLIERQFGHQAGNPDHQAIGSSMNGSNALMIYSMARKVWDSVFQGQKNILSEALEVSLTLPAFTLETSIDLMQLRADIEANCKRIWYQYVDSERSNARQQSRRPNSRSQKDAPTSVGQFNVSSASNAATSAVNLLSGRLTKVVNAASFVSRVVGVTASNVSNLAGERLGGQSSNASKRKDSQADIQAGKGVTSGQSAATAAAPNSTNQQHANNNNGLSSEQQINALNQIHQTKGLFTHETLTKQDVDGAFQTHTIIIEDYISSHLAQKNHKLALHRYIRDDWLDMEFEILLRERAIFGPMRESKLNKWCLDMTEGPKRMRKKMFNNTRFFYENYPYKAELHNPDNKSLRYRPPMSFHCQDYYYKTLKLDQEFLAIEPSISSKENMSNSQQTTGQISPLPSKQNKQQETTSNQEQETDSNRPKINVDSPSPTKSIQNEPNGDAVSGSVDFSIDDLKLIKSNGETDTKQASNQQRPPSSMTPVKSCSIAGSDVGDIGNNNLANDGDGDSTSFGDFDPEIEAETNSARESENIDSLSVLRLLEKNERISHMFRCSRVQGLDTHEGLMLFGREHFYLIDGFTLLKTREIKDIDSLPPDAHDPIIPNSTPNLQAHSSKKICAKFAFDGVVEVHKRRYLLQPIALEVFSSDGRNSLIVFPRNIRNKVYGRLMSVSTQLNSNAHESLAGQKSNVSVEGGGGLFSSLIGETSVTQRWVRGELSNFQYLMNLNTIAGRSYNDLMQYPIFPWILADYSSDQLDLNKPSTFRDLSRPIGAQTKERLEQFKRRFAEWDDTETPPYHYGTFYSSAMIVASYMVRMEPFTQHFLRLQGGHFDLADRMFHSIQDSWLSASKHNMADIKELIPEFFYLPEFLVNENRYDLGIKQNGNKLDDVILPPWAKNDAREFIRLHRSALESEYVSGHLHEWIDLIFGHKQQGSAAIDAVNVFHHLFYEGNVDIYNTDIDPIKKNAVIGFINNFGQVPKQLFKKPHPVRKVLHLYGQSGGSSGAHISGTPSPILPSLSIVSSSSTSGGPLSTQNAQQHPGARNLTHCPQSLRLSTTPSNPKDLRGPVGQIVHIDKTLVAVEQNKLLIPPEYCRYIAWGHADRSLRLGLYDSEKSIFVWEGSDSMAPSDILCCTIPNNRTIITAGMDCMLTVWKIERMKSFAPMMNLYGHTEPVTCLASSQAYSLILSGSRDRSAILWDLNQFTFLRQLGGGEIEHPAPISAIAINDSTGDIATCASNWLFLWTINGELLAKVDALQASIKFQYQPSINNQNSFFPNSTISGNTNQLHILSVCFSQFREWSLDEVIVTGGSDGSVLIWSMRYTQKSISASERAGRKLERYPEKQPTGSVDSIDEVITTATTTNNNDEIFSTATTDQQQRQQAEILAAAKEQAKSRRRERTDTINSDWVKLSESSTTSTMDIVEPLNPSDNSGLNNNDDDEDDDNNDEDSSKPKAAGISIPDRDNQQPVRPPRSSTPVNIKTKTNELAVDDESNVGDLSSTSLTGQQQTSKHNLLVNTSDPSLLKFSKSDSSIVDSFVILGETPPGNTSLSRTIQQQQQAAGSTGSKPSTAPSITPRPKSSVGSGSSSSQNTKGSHSGVTSSGLTRTASATRDNYRGSLRSTTTESMSSTVGGHLSPGHKWARELYLRTIISRRDTRNNCPAAAVTSLTISKNHRTIFVGDASGKVTSWSV